MNDYDIIDGNMLFCWKTKRSPINLLQILFRIYLFFDVFSQFPTNRIFSYPFYQKKKKFSLLNFFKDL